jgi:hypothetical protein
METADLIRIVTSKEWKINRMHFAELLLFVLLSLSVFAFADAAVQPIPQFMWYRNVNNEEPYYYVAFRGHFDLKTKQDCDIQIIGASWYVGWMDGHYFCEGPARFPTAYPEYQTYHLHLSAGRHVLAIEVHQVGVVTRILDNPRPFLHCVAMQRGVRIPVIWKCIRLNGYDSQVRRINPELGFIEWCDTRQIPAGWKEDDFDDSGWNSPVPVNSNLGKL